MLRAELIVAARCFAPDQDGMVGEQRCKRYGVPKVPSCREEKELMCLCYWEAR
jgi:hypothetical protein